MSILKGRKLSGKAWKVAGAVSSSATTYTSALSASSGAVGAPVTDTFTPNAPWASGQTILLGATTLSGTFGSAVGGTLAGSVLTLTPGGSSASVVFTPSSVGGTSGTITTTPSGGLTSLSGAQGYTVNAAAATAYTTSLASASGTVGTPVVVSYTPNGQWQAGQTITPTDSGLTGAFTAGSGGTFAGGVLTPTVGSSAPATVIFTSSAASSGTINSTAGGLTNTSGAQNYQAVTAGAAPAAFTDFTLVQPKPVHPMMGSNGQPGHVVGYLTTTGGIGQFRYEITGGTGNYGSYAVDIITARVSINGNGAIGLGADTVVFKVTDGRGVVLTKTISIAKQPDSSPNIFFNCAPTVARAITDNTQLFWASNFVVQAYDTNGFVNNQNMTVTDTANHWFPFYGSVSTQNNDPNTLAPVGSWPITCTIVGDGQTLTISPTITVVAGVTPYIEFPSIALSSATPVGTVVGKLAVLSSFNAPNTTLTDTSGSFKINLTKGLIQVAQPLAAGSLTVTATAQDEAETTSSALTIQIASGTVLPSSAMTATVNTTLDNGQIGQSILTAAPSVAGHTGGTWSFTDDPRAYNPNATLGYYACPARISQNPTNGVMTNVGHLSPRRTLNTSDGSIVEGPFSLVLTWVSSDGTISCQKTLSVPVAWATASATQYVGTGASTIYGSNGFETLAAWRQTVTTQHNDTRVMHWFSDSNPDKYVADNGGSTSQDIGSIVGPVRIYGVQGTGGPQPRGGGPTTGSLANAAGGGDSYGKGYIVFGSGDAYMENIEISNTHCYDMSHGTEAIRKDGQTYGDLWLKGPYVHDNDFGIESGVCHGGIIIEEGELADCGTSKYSSGQGHNAYIGIMSFAIITKTTSRRAMAGHLLKCRAHYLDVWQPQFFGTTGGSSGCCMDLCNAGVTNIYYPNIQKDVMGQNPSAVNWCAERDFGVPGASYSDVSPWEDNQLTITGGNIDVLTMAGAHYGAPTAVCCYYDTDPFGVPMPPPVLNSVSMWLSPNSTRTFTKVGPGNENQDTTPAHQIIDNNPTTHALPIMEPTTRPYLSGSLPVMGTLRMATLYGFDSFRNFESVQQVQGLSEYRLAASSSAGTTIDTLFATGAPYYAISGPSSAINPFGSGTTWSIITDPNEIYYPQGGNPWAPSGMFAVTTHSDGSATFTYQGGGTANTVQWVCLRATGPGGSTSGAGATPAVSDFRYVVTLLADPMTIYVGQGMATAYPGTGFETFAAAKAQLVNQTGVLRIVNIVANSNQNYFADDNGVATNDPSLRFPLQGPINIVGIANGGVSQPRMGGTVGSTQDAIDPRFNAFFDLGDGDFNITNLAISYWKNGQGTAVGINKRSGTSGSVTLTGCNLANNDINTAGF